MYCNASVCKALGSILGTKKERHRLSKEALLLYHEMLILLKVHEGYKYAVNEKCLHLANEHKKDIYTIQGIDDITWERNKPCNAWLTSHELIHTHMQVPILGLSLY